MTRPLTRRQAPTITLEAFTTQWLPEGWSFDELFEWPPDVFAWTSCVLQRSGAYRLAVSPPCAWPDSRTWTDEVREGAEGWLDWVVGRQAEQPDALSRCRAALGPLMRSATFADLASEADIKVASGQKRWDLCRSLLELHALADRCCAGFGSPGINYKYSHTEVQFLADTLLARVGSLSRLPKYIGVVLPKMRTPQNGVTVRALSLYATFHESEIDIIWRAIPWVNIDENTVNLLTVPWPYQIEATSFVPRSRVGESLRSGRARYFSFEPGGASFDPSIVIEMLNASRLHVNRVHVIVLPELALTRTELRALQAAVADSTAGDRIPMIVTGLRTSPKELVADGRSSNRVVLSAFFAEKWYDLEQDKHHRWKIDGTQIEQYGLGGSLSGTGAWWEGCVVPRRRLTFLAPNDWLVLCPLICEDLAQLEPVSEVIRGVGPTLLWALLLDGPQLAHRWSSRYASVLADDPGCSVLTLTALGMAARSVDLHTGTTASNERRVALWKDRETGWRSVDLPQGKMGAVLTLSARWHEEFTIDGRGDGENAALFVLRGMHFLSAPDRERSAPGVAMTQTINPGDTTDIKELTIFTQFVDAALDAHPALLKRLARWAHGQPARQNGPKLSRGFPASRRLLELIAADEPPRDEELATAIQIFVAVMTGTENLPTNRRRATHEGQLERWSILVRQAKAFLEPISKGDLDVDIGPLASTSLHPGALLRVHISVRAAILWAVHNRLTEERRSNSLKRPGAELLEDVQALLGLRYESALRRTRPESSHSDRGVDAPSIS